MNSLKYLFSIVLTIVVSQSTSAFEKDSINFKDTIPLGKIKYAYPTKLDTVLANFIYNNEKAPVHPGYRVQLMASPNRQAVLNFMSEFYKAFPDKRPVLIYQQPNFKLREGTYRNKLDAFREMKKIQTVFPDAFIIRDDIPLGDL